MLALFKVLEGIALLTLGRKLFWLFVALIGFEAGTYIAARVFTQQPEWIVLVFAIGVGIIGALLAIFLQTVVITGAGFIAGGVVGIRVLDAMNWDGGTLSVVAFIIGGIIGAVLVAMLFDWALIILSSLLGAITLTDVFVARSTLTLVVIIVLFVIGIVIQAGWWGTERRRTR